MAITIQTDRHRYSRYEPDAQTITVALAGLTAGDAVTLNLVRQDGYGVVQTTTITPTGSTATATFDLTRPDTDGINYHRRGLYRVQATQNALLALSRPIRLDVLPLDVWRRSYLFGIPLWTERMLQAVAQPQLVSGVTVRYVDPAHLKGPFALAWDATARTLRWANGPTVVVPQSDDDAVDAATVALLTADGDAYIECALDVAALPGVNASETLLIDAWRLRDADLSRYLDQATDWVQQKLHIQIEPSIITTDAATYAGHFDIAIGPQMYERGNLRYIPLMDGHAKPLLKVISLAGYYNDQKALDVPLDWVQIDRIGAALELVPLTGMPLALTPIFGGYGMPVLNASRTVAGFWHYTVVAGMTTLTGDGQGIRDAIAIRAALRVLQDLSLAMSGGRVATQVSRDGIADSISYGGQGAYAEKITQYTQWLEQELPRIQHSLFGFADLVVL